MEECIAERPAGDRVGVLNLVGVEGHEFCAIARDKHKSAHLPRTNPQWIAQPEMKLIKSYLTF